MNTSHRATARMVLCFATALLCGMSPCVAPRTFAAEPSADSLAEFLAQPRFKHAHWGLLFVDQKSGETVYELNSDKLFAPASTTKLFSVACALDTFGADHRFETRVVRRGTVQNGELTGQLILVASGDLTFGGRTTDAGEIAFTNNDHTYANGSTDGELTASDPLAGLNELARQIAADGIQRIRGDVLIDDRLFDKSEATGSGPGRLTPIMINDNLIDFVIEPTEPGRPAKVTSRPQSSHWTVDVNVETIAQSSKRLEAMSFGVADYAASTRARTTVIGGVNKDSVVLTDKDESGNRQSFWTDPWHAAQTRMMVACRAYGLRPIDGPFGDFGDPDGFKAAANRAAVLGYEGKWAIHPSQIELANGVFTPSEAEVTKARRILAAMEQAAKEGKGAVSLDGRLIDIASIRMAEALIAKADVIRSATKG